MSEFEKSIPFKNWTTEKFIGHFNSESYPFEPGGTYNVPVSVALHFAKHLAVRELHKIGTAKAEMLSDPDMKEYMDKCFPTKPNLESPSMSSFERIDEVKDVEVKDAVPTPENKTEKDIQAETDDEDTTVTDEKNNAGAPTFKKPLGRPPKTRDAEYV